MDHMYLDNMRSGNHCGSLATRFRLPAIPDGYKLEDPPLEAHLEHQRPQEANIELMTSNPAYHQCVPPSSHRCIRTQCQAEKQCLYMFVF